MQRRLKELRKELGLTQNEFAVRLGLSSGTIVTWETRGGNVPERQQERIARLFGVNPEWLKTGKGKMFVHGKPVFQDEENDLKYRLKQIRKYLDLTQEDVAERMNIAFSSVSSWEVNGAMPKAKRLLFCKTFGVRLEWLETGEGEMFDQSVEPFIAPREYALRSGCDEVTATIFERFIGLPDKEKKEFSRILTQIASGASSEPAYQVSQDDLTAENVEGSIVLKGHVSSRDITVNNYGK